jgi:hypothetical protein
MTVGDYSESPLLLRKMIRAGNLPATMQACCRDRLEEELELLDERARLLGIDPVAGSRDGDDSRPRKELLDGRVILVVDVGQLLAGNEE